MSVFPISLFLSFFKTFFLPFLNLYLQFCVFEFLSNFWISSGTGNVSTLNPLYLFHKANKTKTPVSGWPGETRNPWESTASRTDAQSPLSSHSEAARSLVCVWTNCKRREEWVIEMVKYVNFPKHIICSCKFKHTCWVPAAGPRRRAERFETSQAVWRTASGGSWGNIWSQTETSPPSSAEQLL